MPPGTGRALHPCPLTRRHYISGRRLTNADGLRDMAWPSSSPPGRCHRSGLVVGLPGCPDRLDVPLLGQRPRRGEHCCSLSFLSVVRGTSRVDSIRYAVAVVGKAGNSLREGSRGASAVSLINDLTSPGHRGASENDGRRTASPRRRIARHRCTRLWPSRSTGYIAREAAASTTSTPRSTPRTSRRPAQAWAAVERARLRADHHDTFKKEAITSGRPDTRSWIPALHIESSLGPRLAVQAGRDPALLAQIQAESAASYQ